MENELGLVRLMTLLAIVCWLHTVSLTRRLVATCICEYLRLRYDQEVTDELLECGPRSGRRITLHMQDMAKGILILP